MPGGGSAIDFGRGEVFHKGTSVGMSITPRMARLLWTRAIDSPTGHGPHIAMGTTTREDRSMPTANPYDRRSEARQTNAWAGDGSMTLNTSVLLEGPDGAIALEDLNAMVASATARARRETREAESHMHAEVVGNLQRRAWQEGHDAGVDDARRRMLADIDDRFGKDAHAMIEQLTAVLGNERATRADLAESVAGAVALLRHLIDAHHAGFPTDEVPF